MYLQLKRIVYDHVVAIYHLSENEDVQSLLSWRYFLKDLIPYTRAAQAKVMVFSVYTGVRKSTLDVILHICLNPFDWISFNIVPGPTSDTSIYDFSLCGWEVYMYEEHIVECYKYTG